MTVIHLKKKDIVKSSVKGVAVEFDHEKLASILGIPGNNGICEYVKDVWEESKYIKPLEITKSGCGKTKNARLQTAPEVVAQASVRQKETTASGVDPSCPTGRIPEAVMNKLQAEFERARANRFQADLEKAQAENARLLALLQQAQTKPKP
ncbi:hypothetical protein Dimus_000756 [Dionaea muscipula]